VSAAELDPDIRRWLAGIGTASEDTTVKAMRDRSRINNALARTLIEGSFVPKDEFDQVIDGPAGAIPVRILSPGSSEPMPIIAFFHGGGWVIGDLDTHLGHARRLCVQARAVVVMVGYRRAPEHRFPAAYEDAVAATEWVAGQAEVLGCSPDLLVAAGDSAGGQLAASVAMQRRDAGLPLAAQLLLYPVTEVSGRYEDDAINARFPSREGLPPDLGLTVQAMTEFARHYVDADSASDWRVSPLQAAGFTGLAPAVVHTAGLDVLSAEGVMLAEAMEQAGVRVIKRRHPSLNHSYFGLGGVSAVAAAAATLAAEDLRDILGLAPASRP
jgi:acetyl esterase